FLFFSNLVLGFLLFHPRTSSIRFWPGWRRRPRLLNLFNFFLKSQLPFLPVKTTNLCFFIFRLSDVPPLHSFEIVFSFKSASLFLVNLTGFGPAPPLLGHDFYYFLIVFLDTAIAHTPQQTRFR